jgi:CheY-like chemotaxis protein
VATARRPVLVIDDDEMIQESIREVLSDEGYDVVLAQNGREALEKLRSGERPLIILLDLMMPVMDGWQFRAEQKKDVALSAIPVIVITAAGSAARGSIDADEFITKPVRLEDLLAAVKRHAIEPA